MATFAGVVATNRRVFGEDPAQGARPGQPPHARDLGHSAADSHLRQLCVSCHLGQPKTEWTRDAAIQRFEVTFELAWKSIGRFARREGLDCPSPRQAFRAALRLGWIADDPTWLGMLDDRNRTSHVYDAAAAEAIFARLPVHAAALRSLHQALSRLLS